MKRKSITVALVISCLLMASAGLYAKPEEPEIRAGDTMMDFLSRHQGEQIEIILRSGNPLRGTLTGIVQRMVRLSRLVGREFFDAVVSLDEIGAVVIRARGK